MDDSQKRIAISALKRAIGRAGGQAALARLVPSLSQQKLSLRLKRGIPLQSQDEVFAVEAATGESRHDLRPDLYPREDPPAQPPAKTPPASAGGSSSDAGADTPEGVQA